MKESTVQTHSYYLKIFTANLFMKVDFGATATDYAKHRPGFPSLLFDRLS